MLPEGPIGDAAISVLRRHGVDTSRIVRSGGRVGIHFLETGSYDRPSVVVYDRARSAISEAEPKSFDWDTVFQGGDWSHVGGIKPAPSQNGADLCFDAVRSANETVRQSRATLNYRAKPWKYGKQAPEVMRELVRLVDVGIANEEEEFPKLRCQAIKLRTSHSASHNEWSACLCNRHEFSDWTAVTTWLISPTGSVPGTRLPPVLICSLLTGSSDQQALDFAVAGSALKHTISGDSTS